MSTAIINVFTLTVLESRTWRPKSIPVLKGFSDNETAGRDLAYLELNPWSAE